MGLFKSKEERRIERQMKIRQGMRAIERSIRQQEKFQEDFIKNAQHARKIGDNNQYLFIRSALKKTAAIKKMLEKLVGSASALYEQNLINKNLLNNAVNYVTFCLRLLSGTDDQVQYHAGTVAQTQFNSLVLDQTV